MTRSIFDYAWVLRSTTAWNTFSTRYTHFIALLHQSKTFSDKSKHRIPVFSKQSYILRKSHFPRLWIDFFSALFDEVSKILACICIGFNPYPIHIQSGINNTYVARRHDWFRSMGTGNPVFDLHTELLKASQWIDGCICINKWSLHSFTRPVIAISD